MQNLNNRKISLHSPSAILLVILALFMVIFATSCTQNAWRQGDESHSQTQQAEALATTRLIQTQQWLQTEALEATQTSEASKSREATQTAQAAGVQTATALATPSFTPTLTPDPKQPPPCTQAGQTWTSSVDGMTLVCVPAGAFSMGSVDGFDDEKPVHEVILDAFWIDRTEVTNDQYAQCVEAGICSQPGDLSMYSRENYYNNPDYANYPVIYVNWNQAHTYCEWAERRLPTEAEWEKAARGTDSRTYPWGESIDCTLTNYNRCEGDTTAVGSYPQGASPYGALDMAGNVWEWVADWYGEKYYQDSLDRNPQGPTSGEYCVLRGGSWYDDEYSLRAANREVDFPSDPSYDFGFRCAHSK